MKITDINKFYAPFINGLGCSHEGLGALLLLFFSFSCSDKVDLKVKEGEKILVVNGWITDQPGPYKVTLNSTANYFKNEKTPTVQGATVIISDNQGLIDTLIETAPGEYHTTSIQGKVGTTYTLFIYNAMGGSYMATTEIKRGAPIDSITYIKDELGYSLRYHGPEPQGKGDYYRLFLSKNDSLITSKYGIYSVYSDEFDDGEYASDFDPYGRPLRRGDKFKIERWSITEDTYKFYSEINRQLNNIGLYATPTSNVRSNVINMKGQGKNAVGYFGGSAVSAVEVVIQ